MKRRSPRPTLAIIPGLALAMTLAATPGAQAQDGFCAILTEAEVGQAFGDHVVGQPSFDGCTWSSDDAEGFFAFVSAYWDSLPMAERQASTTNGQPLTVGGREAFYEPDFYTLYIQLDQGVLAISGQAEQGDNLVPLRRLGELAVGRAAQLPAPATPEPAPSYEADEELEALFPDSVGGQPLQVQTATGEDIFLQSEDSEALQQMEELLVANGLTPSDLSIGIAYPSDMSSSVTALRFPSVEASAFVDGVINSIGGGEAAERSDTQIAGKDVIKLTIGELVQYLYPKGEVIWAVTAQEPALTEIFEALP
jgi:hypothetical protein